MVSTKKFNVKKSFLKSIHISSVCLTNNYKNNQVIETECLFGEEVEVWETKKNKSYVTLLTDNYSGWVNSNALGARNTTSHRVNELRTFVYNKPNFKLNPISYLPLGSMIYVKEFRDTWAKIKLNNQKFGYIIADDIVEKNNKVSDWVVTSEKMVDTPYKWGGRDTLGLDCSALIQLSLQSAGLDVPRNSIDQENFFNSKTVSLDNLERGDLIFWSGHVGVMINKISILHANAHHMKVCIEPVSEVLKREPKYNSVCRL